MRKDHRAPIHRFIEPLTLLLLGGLCYAMFFHGLTRVGLTGPDEPRYASVAREMAESGDFVTPRLNGAPWFEKPVLTYWGSALGYMVFGPGEFGARFPSALGASFTVFFVYLVSKRLWGSATGIWAGLILATSVGWFVFGRAASTDMPLTVSLTMGLLCFLMAYNSEEPRRRLWFIAFYAFLGFGLLAKGPVAVVLPALALAAYLLFRGRPGEWKEWHPKYAWITLAVALPWYVAVIWTHGYEFIQIFFINQNFERFTSTVHGHHRPFYFYIPSLLMLMFPWAFLLLPGVRGAFDRNSRLLAWWAVVPVIFFSFAGSKLPGYILPSVPAIAMLIAREIPKGYSRPFRIATFIQAGAMAFIGIAFGFFGDMLDVDPHVDGFIITTITFGLAAVLAAVALWTKPLVLAVFNVTVMVFAVLGSVTFILPRFDVTDTMRPWQNVLPNIISRSQTVYVYRPSRWMEYGIGYYWLGKTRPVYSPSELNAVLDEEAKPFFLATDRELLALGDIPGLEFQVLETANDQSVFWVWRAP